MMIDQAEGLRRLFGASAVTLTVAARETAVIDAYAQIKRVVREQSCGCFRIAISHARSAEEAQNVFDNMRRVAQEYLGVRLEYLGMTPENGAESAAVLPGPSGAGLRDSVL
jgi:MinD-like ATPase involved in chromosome partitioning or flagellar assembly